jgi:hypothetical protein
MLEMICRRSVSESQIAQRGWVAFAADEPPAATQCSLLRVKNSSRGA